MRNNENLNLAYHSRQLAFIQADGFESNLEKDTTKIESSILSANSAASLSLTDQNQSDTLERSKTPIRDNIDHSYHIAHVNCRERYAFILRNLAASPHWGLSTLLRPNVNELVVALQTN